MATSQAPVVAPVPWADTITPYDEAHLGTYLRLLDAAKDGASDEAMCMQVLNIPADIGEAKSSEILESHLKRARWMCEMGYKDLLLGQ